MCSDNAWASCSVSRMPTSGCALSIDGNIALSYSRTQPVVALNSADAEVNASVVASGEAVVRSIFEQMKIKVSIWLYLDSSAAISRLSSFGRGCLKHIRIKTH